MADAGYESWPDPSRVAVVIGSSAGTSVYNFEQFGIFIERGIRRMHPAFPAYAHSGVIASECAIQLDAHGPVLTISSACTSAADAIGLGRAMIVSGTADIALVGGAEAPIFPGLFAAFDKLDLMPTHFNDQPERASRPFDRDRDGFVLGEGAAILLLESETAARARSAGPRVEVAGYAATCDADNHFSQEASGGDAIRAVELALRDAGAGVADVDYVNAHGSATLQNDSFEARVLRRVLGERAGHVPVSSSKSMLGHLLGACGAVEAIAATLAIRDGFAPPTINLDAPDPECDLDHVSRAARPTRIRTALSTSFGFGSRNAALLFREVEDGASR
jgi:3-oxoacyl-[acyl-carrier-protein] synthase II